MKDRKQGESSKDTPKVDLPSQSTFDPSHHTKEIDYEKMNYQNSIYFYQDELKQIRDGALSTSILTPPESKRLFRYGILRYRKLTIDAQRYLNMVLSGATK